MASKIFGGDMPELMERILNNLDYEIGSLFSCTLVNRYWCKMTIPILWKNPFTFSGTSSFISEYFSSLDEDEKLILKEYGLKADFPNTLFQYGRFLKCLDLFCLSCVARRWIYLQQPNRPKHMTELECHIVNLLFRIFIESGANLYRLELRFVKPCVEIKPEIFYLLGQNKHFLSQIYDLNVRVMDKSYMENAISWLKILGKTSTKIGNIKVICHNGCKPRLSYAYMSIITSQKQLRWFEIVGNRKFPTEFIGIISALESQKKTLKEIKIDECAYSAEFKVLRNCENLEVIRVSGPEVEKILKTFNTSRCNILQISSRSIDASNLVRSLEEAGLLLQRLEVNSCRQEIQSQPLLLKTLITFCPNITYLSFWGITLSVQFLEFIGKLQRLQFLTLYWIVDESEEMMKTSIMHLAKILPSTLQYLNLNNDPLDLHIDTLLNHCDVPLKKLAFNIIYGSHNYDKKIEALIGFCNRKKTLKYVDIIDYEDEGPIPSLDNWDKIYYELEEYVELVPYGYLTHNII